MFCVVEYGEVMWIGLNKLFYVDVCIVVVINEYFFLLVDKGWFCVDLFDCLVFEVVILLLLCVWIGDVLVLIDYFG